MCVAKLMPIPSYNIFNTHQFRNLYPLKQQSQCINQHDPPRPRHRIDGRIQNSIDSRLTFSHFSIDRSAIAQSRASTSMTIRPSQVMSDGGDIDCEPSRPEWALNLIRSPFGVRAVLGLSGCGSELVAEYHWALYRLYGLVLSSRSRASPSSLDTRTIDPSCRPQHWKGIPRPFRSEELRATCSIICTLVYKGWDMVLLPTRSPPI